MWSSTSVARRPGSRMAEWSWMMASRSPPTSWWRVSECGPTSSWRTAAGPGARPRRARGRTAGDQRTGHLRRGRHRPVAGSAHRRTDSGRALGAGPAPGSGRRPKHPRAAAIASTRCRSSGASTTSVAINYSGHAERWDRIEIDGDVSAKDCTLRYRPRGAGAGGGDGRPGPGEPRGGAKDGARGGRMRGA